MNFAFVTFCIGLAAFAFGAWLGYWWLRNRYEDVTETYDSLTRLQDKVGSDQLNLASREDLLGNFSRLQDSVGAIRVPDMTPVHERLIRVEQAVANIRVPETNLDPLHERFTRLEASLMKPDDNLTAIMHRLTNLEGAISTLSSDVTVLGMTDMNPVEERLERLENAVNDISIPETDLTSIHTGLARLELAIEAMDVSAPDLDPIRDNINAMETRLAAFAEGLDEARKSDLETVSIRLATLSSSVAGLRFPDLSAIQDRMVRVENAVNNIRLPDTDFSPLDDRLRLIENTVRAPGEDLRVLQTKLSDIESGSASLQSRLINLEQSINAIRADIHAIPDNASLERRLANVHEAILAIREPDLTPVLGSLRKIDSGMDLGAVENRLTSIEYSLAAMHDMLRTRNTNTSNEEYRPRVQRPLPRYEARESYSPPPPPPPAPQPKPKPRIQRERAADPLSIARRPNDRANLLLEPAFGERDDLEAINGVGPMLDELLNEIGVYYFWQIAEWSDADVEWVDDKLMHFKGRIERDEWVAQAAELMNMPGAARRPR